MKTDSKVRFWFYFWDEVLDRCSRSQVFFRTVARKNFTKLSFFGKAVDISAGFTKKKTPSHLFFWEICKILYNISQKTFGKMLLFQMFCKFQIGMQKSNLEHIEMSNKEELWFVTFTVELIHHGFKSSKTRVFLF